MHERRPHLNARLQGLGTTIFATMTALAQRHDAVNLGQGFPDVEGPAAIRDAAIRAMRDGHNQYAPGTGLPALRAAVAGHQQRRYGLAFDPDDEVTVTAGATEAIAAAILALCEVGDEVVTFEPYYDSYAANIAMAGAVRRTVTLRPPDFALDREALSAAITPRTRMVLLNSPHNPTGKVFDADELAHIAEVCVAHDLLAVTDEVYEHLVFEGRHVPLASLEGMRDRTVTISSAGKSFSFTGWKVGWACAAPPLTAALRTTKQFLTFTNGTPFQHAVAYGLSLGEQVFDDLTARYRARRDQLCAGLDALGYAVHASAGTYFATVDIRPLGYDDGMEFCMRLPERVGVAAVPEVVFYDDKRVGAPLVRFAFCKSEELIDEGLARLAKLAPAGAAGRTRAPQDGVDRP
ncbi:MAG TPA: pyridoxal phosphate-dependent aminotransferase [Euzebyales bacterium]|nr:pyridoxal phosphate-dependent aminotransferase [Euzebyales bacterium]